VDKFFSQALTRYFNCKTRIANSDGILTLTNVEVVIIRYSREQKMQILMDIN